MPIVSNVGSKEVAKLAGVSRSTVSRVFTPGTYVADDTRIRVQRAAELLGYRPNVLARSLMTRRTGLVGIVTGHLENPTHASLVRLVTSGLQDHGMAALLVAAHFDEVDRVFQILMAYQIDALVVTSAVPTAKIAHECTRSGTPLIVANQGPGFRDGVAVFSDNRGGATLVAEHLVEEGWRRFGIIAGREGLPASIEREEAFTLALAQQGHSLAGRAVGNYSVEDAAIAMRELLSGPVPPDAVFCATDEMATSALDVARYEYGLQPGQDIAIAGYGESPLARLRAYDLTSVEACIPEVADATVNVVVAACNGATHSSVVPVAPRLVVRSSTRKPSR